MRARALPLLVTALFASLSALCAVASARPPVAPGAFQLEASNGYSMRVMGVAARGRGNGWVVLFVQRGDASVSYTAPAVITDDAIQSRLGGLGEIDMAFQSAGHTRTQRSSCGGDPVRFAAGSYQGRIDFTGEEEYTRVSATQARGDLRFVLDTLCAGSGGVIGTGPELRGAELNARRAGSRLGLSFTAGKNLPSGRAIFRASIEEMHQGISVTRAIGIGGLPGAFSYDPMLQAATVLPPPPFSGSATYRRHAPLQNRWTGSLSVDFPGNSGVNLVGAGFRAGLARARWDMQP